MSIAAALNVARKYASGGAITASPAQIQAGNYKMRHITFQGIPISIENPKGTIRSGIDSNGKPWANRMAADYGYIKRTEGKDGDQVDAFVGPYRNSDRVFIIDQLHHHKEKFDEHKCLLGFNTKKQALTAYHRSYGRIYGHHHTVGAVTELSVDAFKEWLKGGGGKEPVAPDVPKYQTGGAVPNDPPIEDVPGVGPVPTEAYPELAKIPVGLAREQAEFVSQPRQRMEAQIPQMPEAGQWTEEQEYLRRAGIAQQAEKEAEFGRQASLATIGTGAFGAQAGALGIAGGKLKTAPTAITVGKTAFDLHPDEVASALQTSGTKGTSAGGIFTGFSDGKDRYVKIAKSLDHAKEEVLASKLYELAGVRAAKTELTQLNGKPAVASQIIPKASQLSEFVPQQYSSIQGLKEDAPAHFWLANWDAPGVGSENPLGNIMVAPIGGGQWGAHYVDFGGALTRRGLGGSKGDLFGNKVTETKTMLGPTAKNPLVASVFEGHQIGPDNHVAQRIANISDMNIRDLVNTYGPSNATENSKLANKLIARRDDLAKQYGIEKPHIVGGTEWKPPPEDSELEKFADEFFYEGFNTPGDGEYTLKNPQKDANQLLANHQYGETYNPPGGVNPANYDIDGIVDHMYQMALKNPEHVDLVYKKLPFELQEDVNAKLSQKIEKEGDPWEDKVIASSPSPALKLMNLNKTHSLDQLVNTVKNYDSQEVEMGKMITQKQSDKITQMLDSHPLDKIYGLLKNLSDEEKVNLKSWLSPKAESGIVNLVKNLETPKNIPSIENVNASHSLDQIVHAVKNYDKTQMEVPYEVYDTIPKVLNTYSPEEISNATKNLSLGQQTKFDKWLTPQKLEEVEAFKHAQSLKASNVAFIDQRYYDALEDGAFNWSTYRPKKSTSDLSLTMDPKLLAKAIKLGFNPWADVWKGGKKYPTPSGYPEEIFDPATKDPGKYTYASERAWFAAPREMGAGEYGTPSLYIARAPKAAMVEWPEITGGDHSYFGNSIHLKRLINAGHEMGLDLIVIKNIHDVEGLSDQYAFLNTAALRAPNAEFNPQKLKLRKPLAGLAGGGLFGYGMLRGQEQPDQYAAGGAVAPHRKIGRDAFLYMNPKPPENSFAQCGTCRMFTGTGCAILGKTRITKNMTCGLYVRGQPQYNLKGKEKSLVTPKEVGLIDTQVRCENCRYGGYDCQLFEMLNEQAPEAFDLDTRINPKGCCNAFTKKGS